VAVKRMRLWEEEDEEGMEVDGEAEDEPGWPCGAPEAGLGETRPAAILVADAAEVDFPVIYVNAAFEAATGYRAHEVLGRNWSVTSASALFFCAWGLAIRDAVECRSLGASFGSGSWNLASPLLVAAGFLAFSFLLFKPWYGVRSVQSSLDFRIRIVKLHHIARSH
jgi:hypothetical protein